MYTSTIGSFLNFNIVSDSIVVNYVGDSTLMINSQYRITSGSKVILTYNSVINAIDTSTNTTINYAALNGIRITTATFSLSQNIITIYNLFNSVFNSGTI